MVEREMDLLGHLRECSGVRVDRPFRLAGGPRRIEDHGHRFRIEGRGRALGGLSFQQRSAVDHLVWMVDLICEGQRLTPPFNMIGCENKLGAGVLDSRSNGAIAEAGEDRHKDQSEFEAGVQDATTSGTMGMTHATRSPSTSPRDLR